VYTHLCTHAPQSSSRAMWTACVRRALDTVPGVVLRVEPIQIPEYIEWLKPIPILPLRGYKGLVHTGDRCATMLRHIFQYSPGHCASPRFMLRQSPAVTHGANAFTNSNSISIASRQLQTPQYSRSPVSGFSQLRSWCVHTLVLWTQESHAEIAASCTEPKFRKS
jgi:hypothetical protein